MLKVSLMSLFASYDSHFPSLFPVQVFFSYADDTCNQFREVQKQLFLHAFCQLSLSVKQNLLSQRDTSWMMTLDETLPATGKNWHDVGIWVCLSCNSHIFFSTIDLVKAFNAVTLVYKDYLPTTLDQAMASVTEKSQDGLMRILLEQPTQLTRHVGTLQQPGF